MLWKAMKCWLSRENKAVFRSVTDVDLKCHHRLASPIEVDQRFCQQKMYLRQSRTTKRLVMNSGRTAFVAWVFKTRLIANRLCDNSSSSIRSGQGPSRSLLITFQSTIVKLCYVARHRLMLQLTTHLKSKKLWEQAMMVLNNSHVVFEAR